MRILVLGLTAGLAVAPLAAFADDAAPQAQPISTAPSDQVVCHYYYTHGTVVRHPDCHPVHYWEWRRHRLQEDVREFQMRALDGRP